VRVELVDGVAADEVQRTLAAAGINTTVSITNHALIDLAERGLTDLVRASVHYYNTEEELARLCEHLPK
jgi:cysteine desulfurase / selenocysteine lyase